VDETTGLTILTEFIRPAVQGTLTLLRSAQAHAGSQLKRVVITSSCAAVITIQPTARTFSELNWNEQSIDEVKAQVCYRSIQSLRLPLPPSTLSLTLSVHRPYFALAASL
jgi:hypothetical protein